MRRISLPLSMALVALLLSSCIGQVQLPAPEPGDSSHDWDGDCFCEGPCAEDVGGEECPDGLGSGDCDDLDSARHPEAEEVCNEVDDDCDGEVDEDLPVFDWYLDLDLDGYGDVADTISGCAAPEGYVDNADDCDDSSQGANPGDLDGDGSTTCDPEPDCDDNDDTTCPLALELCDAQDNDCDGAPDPDEADSDGDGWRVCDGDCDDGDLAINPDATELWNGIDDDCSGDVPLGEGDTDGDGSQVCDGDCDDADADVFPGAPEGCNGVDDDCDGDVDEDLPVFNWYLDRSRRLRPGHPPRRPRRPRHHRHRLRRHPLTAAPAAPPQPPEPGEPTRAMSRLLWPGCRLSPRSAPAARDDPGRAAVRSRRSRSRPRAPRPDRRAVGDPAGHLGRTRAAPVVSSTQQKPHESRRPTP